MAERKSLMEGLKTTTSVDPALEKAFVHGEQAKPKLATPAPAAHEKREAKAQVGNSISRAPLTTRIRTDYSEALKRASLERQLSATFPNTLQEILEEALEPWLRSNGYPEITGLQTKAREGARPYPSPFRPYPVARAVISIESLALLV